MANLERESIDACATALLKFNFKPKRRGLFLQPGASKDVSGWLGLNTATFRLPASLEVNPVIGVRHVLIETAMVELDSRRPPFPSVSRPLGYLMPQNAFRQWTFPAGGDLPAIANDLAAAVAAYGQSFIDRYSDWNVFSSEIESSGLLPEHDEAKMLPIVLALDGNRGRADELVRRELERIADGDDMYSRSYRAFAANFASKDFGAMRS